MILGLFSIMAISTRHHTSMLFKSIDHVAYLDLQRRYLNIAISLMARIHFMHSRHEQVPQNGPARALPAALEEEKALRNTQRSSTGQKAENTFVVLYLPSQAIHVHVQTQALQQKISTFPV